MFCIRILNMPRCGKRMADKDLPVCHAVAITETVSAVEKKADAL
jgi:hypothetical protein